MKIKQTNPVIKIIALSLALVLLASTLLLIPAEAADTSSMGALVDSFTANNYTFTLGTTSRFFIVASSAPSGDLLQTVQLSQRQFAADGFPTTTVMPIVWGDEAMALAGDIVIKLSSTSGIAAEGYTLNVTTKAVVTASDVDGLLYGLNMLQKHFRVADENAIKGFTAADAPDTKERTVSLECGRKYYTKDWICNFIKEMSWMGYNTIQLHFAEDSGIRMDLWDEDYYKGQFQPKNDFSWICGSEDAYYLYIFSPEGTVTADPYKDEYLTTAQVIEILNTAKEYHIDVIPSFDSPGHMDYLTWKYEYYYKAHPSYSFTSSKFTNSKTNTNVFSASEINGIINYTSTPISKYYDSTTNTYSRPRPFFKAFDVTNEQAKAFVFELYTDIANFFKEYAGSTDFSICADEVVLDKTFWGDTNTYTYNYGYPEFVTYINELYNHLDGMGYNVRAYNDFIGTTKTIDGTKISAGYDLSNFPSDLEIMYWSSNFNSVKGTQNALESVAYFTSSAGNNAKQVYNCISDHTYYAQAYYYNTNSVPHADCRCPSNTQWTMGYSTEDRIYDWWYPANFAPYGLKKPSDATSTTYVVDESYVAGAYYLIWSDNPTLSTEAEMWNGFYSCQDDHLYVSLFDRMWSNIIKMWNWDVNTTTYNNSTLTYTEYAALRDDFKNRSSDNSTTLNAFPGFTGSSTAASMPASTAPVEIVSQSALSSAIGTKLAKGVYTDDSYNAYSTAYDAAKAAATDTSMTAAEQATYSTLLSNYTTAFDALTLKTFTITVNHYVKNITTPVKASETHTTTTSSNHYEIEVANLRNYAVESVSGSSYTPGSSGVTLYGDATGNLTINVYYKEIVDFSQLNALIAEGNYLSSSYYTEDSWAAYTTALDSAKTVANNANATQTQVDTAATALQTARDALKSVDDPKATPLTAELLSTIVPKGKQVGIRVMSDASVETLTITCNGTDVEPVFCSSQAQQLYDGDVVRCWLVFIEANTAGTFTYTINDSINVTVTVVESAST